MKKTTLVFLLILCAFCFFAACQKKEAIHNGDILSQPDEQGRYAFDAKVLDAKENGAALLESVTEGLASIPYGSQVWLGAQPSSPSFEKGDTIRVYFDGMVMETYPLQLSKVYEVILLD